MGTFIFLSDARIMERVHMRAMNVTVILKGAIRENGLWSWITDTQVLLAASLMNDVIRTEVCMQTACTTVCKLNVLVLYCCLPACLKSPGPRCLPERLICSCPTSNGQSSQCDTFRTLDPQSWRRS